jgi:hypothetical protein
MKIHACLLELINIKMWQVILLLLLVSIVSADNYTAEDKYYLPIVNRAVQV